MSKQSHRETWLLHDFTHLFQRIRGEVGARQNLAGATVLLVIFPQISIVSIMISEKRSNLSFIGLFLNSTIGLYLNTLANFYMYIDD